METGIQYGPASIKTNTRLAFIKEVGCFSAFVARQVFFCVALGAYSCERAEGSDKMLVIPEAYRFAHFLNSHSAAKKLSRL